MTFFGKRKSSTLFDQQAFARASDQKREKRKRLAVTVFKISIGFIVAVVLLNIGIRLPSLYSKITKPFKNIQSDFYNNNSINIQKRTNILLITVRDNKLQEIGLASFEPGKNKVVVLTLDPKTRVNGKNGTLGMSDLIKFRGDSIVGIDQLSAALIETVFYYPDGYIILTESSNWLDSDSLNLVVDKSSFSPSFFLDLADNKSYLDQHLQTNLTVGQIYQLASVTKKIKPQRFEIVEAKKFQTGTGFLDTSAFNNVVGVKLNDSEIVEGNYAVEIVNASGVEGLGSIMKTVISNLGANVVQVSSADQRQEKSQVFTTESGNYLAKRLEGIVKGEISSEKLLGSVDVRIVIGENFGEFFNY